MSLDVMQIHGWYGRPDAVPAARGLSAELFAAASEFGLGIGDDDAGAHLPPELRWGEREALKSPAETAESISMVVAIFLGTTSAGWAIDQVLDELLTRTRSGWRRLLAGSQTRSDEISKPESAIVQIFSRSESELVEIWLPLGTDADPDAILDVAAEAGRSTTTPGNLVRYRIQRDLTIKVETHRLDNPEAG